MRRASAPRLMFVAVGLGLVVATLITIACGVDVVGEGSSTNTHVDSGIVDTGRLSDVFDDGGGSDANELHDTALVDDGSPCNARGGPRMVDVGGYCVDATEVTQEQFAAFVNALATGTYDAGALPVCGWKTTYTPSLTAAGYNCHWQPDASPNLAVVCVDWCDAEAFCRWSGKRLCGAIDGGSISWDGDDTIDPNKDAWYRACSKAGTLKYGYGTTYIDKACNTAESGIGRVADAGSQPGCVGGYPGLVDMVGNVDEQEDNCKGTAGAADPCRFRGGSWFFGGTTENSCEHRYNGVEATRGARFADVGFRCCSR